MTYSWMNADGEPIMDGAAWRFEQQLDMESEAEERFYAQYEDDYYADEPTCDNVDEDDEDEQGRLWCYGCDGYADHTLPVTPDPEFDSWFDGAEL